MAASRRDPRPVSPRNIRRSTITARTREAFQIADDLLDVERRGGARQKDRTGRPLGKTTFVTQLGIEAPSSACASAGARRFRVVDLRREG